MFISTKVLIKMLICTSVAIKVYILTNLSEEVPGGLSSKHTTGVGLPYLVSQVGKQLLLNGWQAFSDPPELVRKSNLKY